MARKAELSLTGRQRDQDGEESVTESRMTADYYEKDGSSYILYEETQEDSGDIVRSIIKYNGSTLEMTRRGAVRSRMIFQAGQAHRTDYVTPYGTLPLEVATREASFSRNEDGTVIRLEYTLSSGGQFLSHCTMDIVLRFL